MPGEITAVIFMWNDTMHFCQIRSQSHFLNSILFAYLQINQNPALPPLYSRHVRLGGRGLPLLPHSWVSVYILQHFPPHSTAAQPVGAGVPPAGFSPSCGPASENCLRKRRRPSTTTASSSRRRNWSQEAVEAARSLVPWQNCNLALGFW